MDQLDKIIKKNVGKVEDLKKKTQPSSTPKNLKKESKSKTEEKTKKIETSSI